MRYFLYVHDMIIFFLTHIKTIYLKMHEIKTKQQIWVMSHHGSKVFPKKITPAAGLEPFIPDRPMRFWATIYSTLRRWDQRWKLSWIWWICGSFGWKNSITPPKFNIISPWKMVGWKTFAFPIGFRSLFRGELLNFGRVIHQKLHGTLPTDLT